MALQNILETAWERLKNCGKKATEFLSRPFRTRTVEPASFRVSDELPSGFLMEQRLINRRTQKLNEKEILALPPTTSDPAQWGTTNGLPSWRETPVGEFMAQARDRGAYTGGVKS
jgi:hypothetical protein